MTEAIAILERWRTGDHRNWSMESRPWAVLIRLRDCSRCIDFAVNRETILSAIPDVMGIEIEKAILRLSEPEPKQ